MRGKRTVKKHSYHGCFTNVFISKQSTLSLVYILPCILVCSKFLSLFHIPEFTFRTFGRYSIAFQYDFFKAFRNGGSQFVKESLAYVFLMPTWLRQAIRSIGVSFFSECTVLEVWMIEERKTGHMHLGDVVQEEQLYVRHVHVVL